MPTSLPSSYAKGVPAGAEKPAGAPPIPASVAPEGANPFIFLGVLAFIISLAAFYGAFFYERPISASQKEALLDIAQELRAVQNRDIVLSAPVQTTLYLDQSYPAKDMFPSTFTIPFDFQIPLDTQLVAVSATGQPVYFRVQENVPVKANVQISSAQAFGNATIRIKKDFPVETRFSSTIRIRTAYGNELNNIIDKLERLAGEGQSGN